MIGKIKIFIFLKLLALLVVSPFVSHATHLVGADVSYRCLSGNQYELTFVLYQDCDGGNQYAIQADSPLRFGIFTGATLTQFYYEGEIHQFTRTFIPSEFSNECINNPPYTCLQKSEFKTIVTLPPSAYGYRILYQRCCRNNNVLNIQNSGNLGGTYYVEVPPSTGQGCANNSPTFNNFPPQVICKDNPFRYDFSATDLDGDSLSYRLCDAYPGASTTQPIPDGRQMVMPTSPIPYMPPYNGAYPVDAFPPLVIDPVTGLMTGTPTRLGRYIVTVCVDEWRNGALINSISRDIQFTVTGCSRAVVANMPYWLDQEDVYTIKCDGNQVKFINTSTGGFSYLWRFGVGDATSTDAEPTFTYPGVGEYEVTLIVNPGTTCVDSITKKVIINPYFDVDFDVDGVFCPNETISFTSNVNTTIDSAIYYKWIFDNGDTAVGPDASYSYAPPGGLKNVILVTTSNLGCTDTIVKQVNIDSIDVFAGNDTFIVKNYDFSFRGSGATYYEWTPTTYLSDPSIPNPSAKFPEPGVYTYYLRGTTPNGCEDIDTIVINVVDRPQMFLPNAFSPNGDGLNDVFAPSFVGYALINTLEVFNRYGQLVYKSSMNNNPGWDGTFRGRDCDVGVYYYRITFTDPYNPDRHSLTGDVTLLR